MFNLLSRHSYEDKFDKAIPKDKIYNRTLSPELEKYMNDTIYPDFMDLKGKMYIMDETELENYSTFAIESKFREIERLATKDTGHRNRFSNSRPCTIIKVF